MLLARLMASWLHENVIHLVELNEFLFKKFNLHKVSLYSRYYSWFIKQFVFFIDVLE
jgi:hypothetical protein